MNRRVLLKLSASVAAVTVLPAAFTPAVALGRYENDPRIQKMRQIDEAFGILEDYQFDLAEKAGLFGLFPHGFRTTNDLRKFVHDYILDMGNRDGWARVQFIISIRRQLEKRCGGNLTAQLKWMRAKEEPFPHRSLREMMNSKYYMDLHAAVLRLGGQIFD